MAAQRQQIPGAWLGRSPRSSFELACALAIANASCEDRPAPYRPAKLLKLPTGGRDGSQDGETADAAAIIAARLEAGSIAGTRQAQKQRASCGMSQQMLNSAPYFMTALSLDGKKVVQTPLSIRYFGDVSSQPNNTLDTALPMALLQRLFQLEGQQTLQNMLAAVLSNRSAAADSSGEEQGWRRVIRVPVTCVPGAHAPRLHLQGSVGHGQGARSPSQPLASPRVADAPAELLNSFSHASLGSTHGSASACPFIFSTTLIQEDSRQTNNSCSSLSSNPDHGQAVHKSSPNALTTHSQNLLTSESASALSVALRHAPQRVKSMLDLTMASRSSHSSYAASPSPSLQSTNGLSCELAGWRSRSGRGSKRSGLASAGNSCRSIISLQSMQRQRLSNCIEAEDEGRCSKLPMAAHSQPQLHIGGQNSLERWDATTHSKSKRRGASPSRLASRRELSFSAVPSPDSGMESPMAEASGGLLDLLLDVCATGGSTATDSTVVPPVLPDDTRVPPVLPAIARAKSEPRPPVGVGEQAEAGQDSAAVDPHDCHWHEVFVTTAVDEEDGRELLLIYQTDVTMRTQLETTMAALTDAQLNTLCQLFPRHVIEFLSTGGDLSQPANLGTLARSHADVAILFTDICGFTSMSKQVAPDAVMIFLNELFSKFDDLCAVHGVQKVETAGDCYIVSSGVLSSADEGFAEVADEHDPEESTARMFAMAQDMLAAAKEVLMPHDSSPVQIRIGIHTGPCVSGVVGSKLPKYGIFGDTMNTASRMESTCTPGRIQVSSTTHTLLMRSGESVPEEWEATGGVAVKGKGVMETYLWRERTSSYQQPSGEWLEQAAFAAAVSMPAAQPPPSTQDLMQMLHHNQYNSISHDDHDEGAAQAASLSSAQLPPSSDATAHSFSSCVRDQGQGAQRSPVAPAGSLHSQPDALLLASAQGERSPARRHADRGVRCAPNTRGSCPGMQSEAEAKLAKRGSSGTGSAFQAIGQVLSLLNRRSGGSGNGSGSHSPQGTSVQQPSRNASSFSAPTVPPTGTVGDTSNIGTEGDIGIIGTGSGDGVDSPGRFAAKSNKAVRPPLSRGKSGKGSLAGRGSFTSLGGKIMMAMKNVGPRE